MENIYNINAMTQAAVGDDKLVPGPFFIATPQIQKNMSTDILRAPKKVAIKGNLNSSRGISCTVARAADSQFTNRLRKIRTVGASSRETERGYGA